MNNNAIAPQTELSLEQLFPELHLPEPLAGIRISGIASDSRQVAPGELFVAVSGARVDGQQFINAAVQNGANAIAVESSLARKAGSVDWCGTVPVIAVANLPARISELAGQCYGSPSTQLKVIGVTGTNGKSTCVSLISQFYNLLGQSAGTLGTLGAYLKDQRLCDIGMTTPDSVLCQKLLAQLRDAGAQAVAMEVSSHGLDQNRVAGINFRAAIFTNISHDHLDYHETLERYAAAKQRLFEAPALRAAIINLDDPHAQQMMHAAKQQAKVFTYSLLHFAADIFATDIQYSTQGVEFRLVSPWGEDWVLSPLLGEFNVYNLIAALAALRATGANWKALLRAVPQLQSVPGRMQKVAIPADVIAVVDYAHTPDALAQAIAATRVHASGQLWVIFGCGGDRDRTKRPAMAKVAERFADQIIVTSDNPRNENPRSIIAEIATGFRHKEPMVIVDRAGAIQYAIANAEPGDVILIAGKGHETYQIVGQRSIPFDDMEVAAAALQARPLPERESGL